MSNKPLHQQLISLTISAGGAAVSTSEVARVFTEYLERAIPGIIIHDLQPIRTTAALNSVSATVRFTLEGQDYDAFAKTHIESNRHGGEISSAAGAKEYENAAMLKEWNWPVIEPIEKVQYNAEYPVLLYPRIDCPTLFSLLELSYTGGQSKITDGQRDSLRRFEEQAGRASLNSLKVVRASAAADETTAPMQTLFQARLAPGGRVDQWYKPNTLFELPGIAEALPWSELLGAKWVVNGHECSSSLRSIIDRGRKLLAFEGEESAAVCISHGDDHAGNVFLESGGGTTRVFDPAFAGWNPAVLSHVKAFFHSGIAPLAGLYYDPRLETCSYEYRNGAVYADVSFDAHPLLEVHSEIAKNIADLRILPTLAKMKELGLDVGTEVQRFKSAMTTCCFLVINVAMLLANNKRRKNGEPMHGGTGEGLLPLLLLCDDLTGIPQLRYIAEEFEKLV